VSRQSTQTVPGRAKHVDHHRFIPVYFERDISNGQPVLTAEGRRVVEEELALAASSPSIP
jgi:hypothetical protein